MAKKNIKIRFIGKNSSDVTGSCILVETPHRKILLECGLYQDIGNTLDVYNINNEHFDFKANEIDYVFLNHTHIDHCGRLPLLYKRGCTAQTIVPHNNAVITEILLRDSAKVAQADAADLSRQYNREYAPLYDNDDVTNAMDYVSEYPFSEVVTLDEYIQFRFTPSGHILGSAQLELWIQDDGPKKKILYTSDLGNVHIKKAFTTPFEPIKNAHIVIGESTYGDEPIVARQKMRNKDVEKLQSAIESVCKEQRGKILIPVFANSRAQEMLLLLYQLYGDDPSFRIPVLFDTPMGITICNAYSSLLNGSEKQLWEEAMQWKAVKFIDSALTSQAWQHDAGPAIILSTSGMMTHGRSRQWCRNLLPSKNNLILFCGFSVENSLAALIKEGKRKKIKLSGEWLPNRCRIANLRSFSSHMQQDSLTEYYASIDCEKIYLVHGERKSKETLCNLVNEAIAKNDKSSRCIAVSANYEIKI